MAGIADGASIAIAGFFVAGTPRPLIRALARRGAKDLTIICQQIGPGNEEITELVLNGQIKKAICCYPFFRSPSQGAADPFECAVREGKIELEVFPMGTFAEKLRAGGSGIAAFYTPTGAGTVVERGKEKRAFGGRDHLLELALRPDFAFVHAFRGDKMGNLTCRKTSRNYNPEMAMAAEFTIAEVEDLVQPGALDPDSIHVPGIYVRRVLRVERVHQAVKGV